MTEAAREAGAAAALLRSPDAAGPLLAALTGSATSRLSDFGHELTSWHYRPGAEATAGYLVHYRVNGKLLSDHLFATTAEVGPPAASLSSDGRRLWVWRHPQDPRLPSLGAACDPNQVASWLTDLNQAQAPRLDLDLLNYRPLRRAVLRARTEQGSYYLKVLRPHRTSALLARQKLLAAAKLTEEPTACPAPGVVITPAAAGCSLAESLSSHLTTATPLPAAAQLVELLDRLPAAIGRLPRRPAWSDRLDFHLATAADRIPEQRPRLSLLTGSLRQLLAASPASESVATHGDFHLANIFVSDAALNLIDLENLGPGRRADDLACLLAHLAVLPQLSPRHYPGAEEVLQAWTADFAARVPTRDLYARVAAVLLSLISGGDQASASHRLDLAEAWANRSMREP